MGFKPGMAIGARQDTQSASTAPIEIKIKSDGRGGLGMATQKQEESIERVKRHLAEAEERNARFSSDNFRSDKRSEFELKLIHADLNRSKRVCRQLEMESGEFS